MASGDMDPEGRERSVYLCDRGTSTGANQRPSLRSRDQSQPITGARLGSQCRSKLRVEVGQLQDSIEEISLYQAANISFEAIYL